MNGFRLNAHIAAIQELSLIPFSKRL